MNIIIIPHLLENHWVQGVHLLLVVQVFHHYQFGQNFRKLPENKENIVSNIRNWDHYTFPHLDIHAGAANDCHKMSIALKCLNFRLRRIVIEHSKHAPTPAPTSLSHLSLTEMLVTSCSPTYFIPLGSISTILSRVATGTLTRKIHHISSYYRYKGGTNYLKNVVLNNKYVITQRITKKRQLRCVSVSNNYKANIFLVIKNPYL